MSHHIHNVSAICYNFTLQLIKTRNLPDPQIYNEQELLQKIADGDEHSFRILFNEYWDRIYNNILHICKLPELAEDLAQEAFIRIWQNRQKLPELRRFDSFLYTVSKHLVIDEFRKKVLPRLGDDFFSAYFADDALNGLEQIELKELESTIRHAVEQLPPQMQRVFILHRFNGLSHEEIARDMNISRVSSQTYMARALIHLRAFLAKRAGDLSLLAYILLQR